MRGRGVCVPVCVVSARLLICLHSYTIGCMGHWGLTHLVCISVAHTSAVVLGSGASVITFRPIEFWLHVCTLQHAVVPCRAQHDCTEAAEKNTTGSKLLVDLIYIQPRFQKESASLRHSFYTNHVTN